MAHFTISTNKNGDFVARIFVSGKDSRTGEPKQYTKRLYNDENLSESKFRKLAEKSAILFEEEVSRAYEEEREIKRNKVLTFAELMKEWKASIKASYSVCYYERALDTELRFNSFLEEQGLANSPISDIRVRDVQMFLNTFILQKYEPASPTYKLKKELPKGISLRELERSEIISRYTSYYLRKYATNIQEATARKLCEHCKLNFNEYFELASVPKTYSQETVKGYRRILRTLFNEAVRYDWITKNPVCGTKVGAGSNNTSLRPIHEKEVFSFVEAQRFLDTLDTVGEEQINKRIMAKIMLLTGVRNAELHGLKWEDIDFDKKMLYVHRNRMYSSTCGIYEKPPKTKTSIRYIPIPQSLIDDLRKYYEWFKLADDDFDNKLDQYYLAVNVYRQPESPQAIGAWLKQFEKKYGFTEVSCHGLRHTYCSLLLSQNVPIQTVSNYMGHSDSTITLKVYSHFIPDTQDKVLYVLDNLTKKKD